MARSEHQPRTHQAFWCNCCDNSIVDSDKPDTGKFFVQFGHAYSAEEKEYSGEYLGVMYALCPACLNK